MRPQCWVPTRPAEGAVDPLDRVRVAPAEEPVDDQGGAQLEQRGGGVLCGRPLERRGEVPGLGVEPGEMLLAVGSGERRVGPVALGEREVEAMMALVDGVCVRERCETLGGVGADRLQHPQPGASADVPADEQALGDQPVERVDAGAGDRLRRLHRRAPGEYGEAREAVPFLRAQQLVAPVDGCAQRPVAGRRVARRSARRAHRGVEALGDLGGREQPAARGGQLDRERQPVDPPADLGDRSGVVVVEAEAGVVRSRAFAEQPDGRDLRQRRRVRLACGQRQWRYRMRLLGLDAQRLAARREHREVGARGGQRADEGRGARQVLAVVEDQQEVLDGQEALDRAHRRLAIERRRWPVR